MARFLSVNLRLPSPCFQSSRPDVITPDSGHAPPLPQLALQNVSWSLGEIEALAIKAARGAGLTWGVAQEAGYAVRWLQASGAPGVAALANLLQDYANGEYAEIGRRAIDSCNSYIGTAMATDADSIQQNRPHEETANTKPLLPMCPLHTGIVLSDCESWQLRTPLQLRQPLLLLPFVSQLAKLKSGSRILVTLNTPGAREPASVLIGHDNLSYLSSSDNKGWHTATEGQCQYQLISQTQPIQKPLSRVPDTEQPAVTTLERFAHKTYAPATDESRRKGAGSELSDND